MNIEELAKEIKEQYKILKENKYNEYNWFRGKYSKASCIRLIDLLRQELLNMKYDIKNGGRK